MGFEKNNDRKKHLANYFWANQGFQIAPDSKALVLLKPNLQLLNVRSLNKHRYLSHYAALRCMYILGHHFRLGNYKKVLSASFG